MANSHDINEPVAWQFFEDGKWWIGSEYNHHRQLTEEAGYPIRELYAAPVQQAEQAPVALQALKAAMKYYDMTDSFYSGGCEHGFNPSKSCPNKDCEEAELQRLIEMALEDSQHPVQDSGKYTFDFPEGKSIKNLFSTIEPVCQEPVAWQGAEEWEPLAFQLCADENGEESCNELLWDGGAIPEPWGDRWLKYEDEAKRMIEYVRKYAAPVQQAEQAPVAEVHNTDTPSNWSIIKPGLPAGTKLYTRPVRTKDLADMFSESVEQTYKDMIEAAVLSERKACYQKLMKMSEGVSHEFFEIAAAAIRARGEK